MKSLRIVAITGALVAAFALAGVKSYIWCKLPQA